MFRFKRSIPVEYDLQGYIYFYCRMYAVMTLQERQRLEAVCYEAAGEHRNAVLDFVTGNDGAAAVCRRHFISESTLERVVKRFYVRMAEVLVRYGGG